MPTHVPTSSLTTGGAPRRRGSRAGTTGRLGVHADEGPAQPLRGAASEAT